jgi:long-chain acyl-CoA synthetase
MLVHEFLERAVAKTPDKEALICQNRRLTYIEIERFSNSLSNALVALGLQKLDRVAIYLENSVESVVSIFGILKAGGIFLTINPQTKSKKLSYILNDCQVKILITDHKLAINYDGNVPDLQVISVNTLQAAVSECESTANYYFWDLIDRSSTERSLNTCIDIDLCSLIYTSGSTGKPKGVMLTHLNMLAAANSIVEYLENTSEDIILNCLPLSFDYGLYNLLMPFKFGGTVILEKSFIYPFQLIGLVNQEKVTGLPLIPTIISIFLQVKNLERYDFSRLRYITTTGQAFPPNHISRLCEVFPHTKIYSMYGLTECKRVLYLPPEQILTKPTSVGKAMPNTEVYLVDEQDQRISKSGIVGEMIVRGSNVMQGYWNLPEETAKTLSINNQGEKSLRTKDLFKMDEAGYFYFVARKDDLIKTGGEQVSPREIEDILGELAGVNEVVAFGVQHDFLGQAIKVALVLVEGSELAVTDILEYCSLHLEKHMIPKYVEICQELPKTSTGKINRKQLESSHYQHN